MRRAYQNRGFSEHPTDIVLQSWGPFLESSGNFSGPRAIR